MPHRRKDAMASMAPDKTFCFRQIHVDAARNSTDDFNPFHEPRRCRDIRGKATQVDPEEPAAVAAPLIDR